MMYEVVVKESGSTGHGNFHNPATYTAPQSKVVDHLYFDQYELMDFMENKRLMKFWPDQNRRDAFDQIIEGTYESTIRPYGINTVWYCVSPIERAQVDFIGYRVENTGNGDGWVLSRPDGYLWECYLGNYSKLYNAKRYAIMHYLIVHPEQFAAHVAAYAMTGRGLVHEYDRLKIVLEAEGYQMPGEITPTRDTNRLILFRGEHINA